MHTESGHTRQAVVTGGADDGHWSRTFGERVEERLRELLAEERRRCVQFAPASHEAIDALRTAALSGGKRLRPGLAFLAFVGAGGAPSDPRVVDAGAAIELLHTGCLLHDDIMDESTVRRNLPTVHVSFEAMHRAAGYRGDSRRFGESVATLVGDLAFFYAMGLIAHAGFDAQRVFFGISVDAGIGQFLDVLGTALPDGNEQDPSVIAHYKTARYTVEGPLHLGAALAGRLDELAGVLSGYGAPLGRAYQLRDDLLGAFGDPAVTGKPVGDDLRQGKCTLLLTVARQRCDRLPASSRELLDRVASADLSNAELRAVQEILIDLGARDRARWMCDTLAERAVAAIEPAPMGESVKEELKNFARQLANSTAAIAAQG
ncbi:MAG: polyprenyl synthetase family protein, partial [Sciscionella sp.]